MVIRNQIYNSDRQMVSIFIQIIPSGVRRALSIEERLLPLLIIFNFRINILELVLALEPILF